MSQVLKILLDLVRPTRGRALVDGLDCRTSSVAVRSRIGYLPAEMPLYREMTGGGCLDFLRALQRALADTGWLHRLLARFDVGDVDLRRRLGDLSHGMKRKFGLIQALMGRSPILILDEPTSGLDPLMIEAFAETVHELKTVGATTILLSSHVLSEVERLCDRVGIIRRGRLVRQTSLADLRRDAPRRVRVFFDGPRRSRRVGWLRQSRGATTADGISNGAVPSERPSRHCGGSVYRTSRSSPSSSRTTC